MLIVSDDGAGFRPRSKKCTQGLCLIGMRERAALIGSTFELESAPGRGTTIHVRLPVKAKRKRRSIRASDATNWGDPSAATELPALPKKKADAQTD